MSAKIYENGSWRDINSAKVYENGAWRDAEYMKIYENGVWRDVYQNLPTLNYEGCEFFSFKDRIMRSDLITLSSNSVVVEQNLGFKLPIINKSYNNLTGLYIKGSYGNYSYIHVYAHTYSSSYYHSGYLGYWTRGINDSYNYCGDINPTAVSTGNPDYKYYLLPSHDSNRIYIELYTQNPNDTDGKPNYYIVVYAIIASNSSDLPWDGLTGFKI